MDQQPLPVRVQPGELDAGGSPRDRQAGSKVGLLRLEVGNAVPQAPGFHGNDEGVVVHEVEENPFLPGQPWKPRLHAVEQLAVRQAVPLFGTPRLLGHEGRRTLAYGLVRDQLPAGMDLDDGPGKGGPLVRHAELREAVHLVAPEVYTEGCLGCRGPDVEDGSPYGQLAPVLHLVAAAVPDGHQVGHQRRLVDDVSRPQDDGPGASGSRPEALDECPARGHQDRRPIGQVTQPVQHPEASAHGLHAGTYPLERQGLPGGEQLDGIVAQVDAKVVGEPLGLGPGRYRHHQRMATGPTHQGGDHHRTGRLGHRQGGCSSAQDGCDGRLVVQEGRKPLQVGAHIWLSEVGRVTGRR